MDIFLSRVSTFTAPWTMLRLDLDPYLLSWHGFTYCSPSITCQDCQLTIDHDSYHELPEESLQQFVKEIVGGHRAGCGFGGGRAGGVRQSAFLAGEGFYRGLL
jgi:hypothetical protein